MNKAVEARLPRNGLALRCLPDSGTVRAVMGPDGAPSLRIPGQMDVAALSDPAVARAYPVAWHQPGRPLALPPHVEAVANLVTSADHCAKGLVEIDRCLPQGMPVLNHPRAVALARRDMAGAVFGGISGLTVPRSRRMVADSPGAFATTFTTGGFRFPVTVEPMFDDGANLPQRIGHPGDWQHLFRGPWGGRPYLITQATDAISPWRLLLGMAGKTAHAEVFNSAARMLPLRPPPVPQGAQALARDLTVAVARCIPLDCWTVEVALGQDSVTFVRLLAGPPVVVPTNQPTPRAAAEAKVRRNIEPALAALLARPAAWRADARRLPAVAHILALHTPDAPVVVQ